MDLITRDAARAAGLKHYDCGRPCVHGHAPLRYVANNQCAECSKIVVARQYAKDPAAAAARRRAWIARNPEKARQYENNKKAKNPELYREIRRRATHKFHHMPTPTRPRPLCCECCGRDVSLDAKGLALDHDHQTGAFRGWICNRCNLGLGKIGDTIEAVERLLAYLKRAQEQWSPPSPSPSMMSSPRPGS